VRKENFADFQLMKDFKVNYVAIRFNDNPTDYKDSSDLPDTAVPIGRAV
jgi:hypothetical protein